MPTRVDEILNAFDIGFELDTINGHVSWIKIDSGDWGAEEEENGHVIFAELNIEIKLLTNNSQ